MSDLLLHCPVSGSFKMNGGEIKIRRADGFFSAFISPDGNDWSLVGSPLELEKRYQTAPLKIGMRVKREYKQEFLLSVIPKITSNGTMDVIVPEPPVLPSPFDDSNSDSTITTAFNDAGVVSFIAVLNSGPVPNSAASSALMTKVAYEGDGNSSVIELTVKIESRSKTGTGYQPAVQLFFAPADAELDSVTTTDNDLAKFQQYVVASLRDKYHPEINHVWV